jgi:RNA polymerase sigma-70 factor (ECF subfamily)
MERQLPALQGDENGRDLPPGAVVDSFEDFFIAEMARFLGAMTVIVQNRSEAEEIVQDAFLKVWERWGSVRGMEEPVGYLYRVGMNLYRSRLRRAGVALRHAVHPSRTRDELAGVEARDEAVRLLAVLTPREREAIVVTGYLGYSSDEAGRLLGIKGDTVRVLVGRARSAIRDVQGGDPE